MTAFLSIKTNEGIIFASDTRKTSYDKLSHQDGIKKLFKINNHGIIGCLKNNHLFGTVFFNDFVESIKKKTQEHSNLLSLNKIIKNEIKQLYKKNKNTNALSTCLILIGKNKINNYWRMETTIFYIPEIREFRPKPNILEFNGDAIKIQDQLKDYTEKESNKEGIEYCREKILLIPQTLEQLKEPISSFGFDYEEIKF